MLKYVSNRIYILLFLIVAAFGQGAIAQSYTSEELTVADGLSQGVVMDMLIDQDGFLWAATWDGLNRYNGYQFEVFAYDPFDPFSILQNEIYDLFEDHKGNIWVAFGSNMIAYREKTSGKFYQLELASSEHQKFDINSFQKDVNGSIYAISNQGLVRLQWKHPDERPRPNDPNLSGLLTVETLLKADNIVQIEAINDKAFIIALKDKGVFKFTLDSERLEPIHPSMKFISLEKSGAKHDRVWILEDKRLGVFENGKLRFLAGEIPASPRLGNSRIEALKNNQLFVQMVQVEGGGTEYYHCKDEEALLRKGDLSLMRKVATSKTSDASMAVDDHDNLWIGTTGHGIIKLSLFRQPFTTLASGASIRKLFYDQGIYAGLIETNGYFEVNEQTQQLSNTPAFDGEPLVNIFKASNGVVYRVAEATDSLWTKLSFLKNGKNKSLLLNLHTYGFSAVAEDKNGRIWLGGGGTTVACFNPLDESIKYLPFPTALGESAYVNDLMVDAAGNLWVGTYYGLLWFDLATLKQGPADQLACLKYKTFTNNPKDLYSLRSNTILSLMNDPKRPKDYIWVATKGGGLQRLETATGKFRSFIQRNSDLPNDVVYGMLADLNKNIWLSTNAGLSRLTLDYSDASNHNFQFKNFKKKDGLQEDEFNLAYAKSSDGRFFFGGINGITAFRPSEIIDRESDAKTLLTNISLNNQPLSSTEQLELMGCLIHDAKQVILPHDKNLISFEFSLMDFNNTKENQYRYRLVGADPDWVYADTRNSATYANLSPGTYTFEVQGSIGGGVWQSKSAQLSVEICPPWWATVWAYLVYAAMLGGIVWGFYHIQIRRRLEQQNAQRLLELNDFKNKIFTNISHEFRTPLTVVLGNLDLMTKWLEKLRGQLAESDISQVPDMLISKTSITKRNAERLLLLINQILDLAKLESNTLKLELQLGDIVPYLMSTAEGLAPLAEAKHLRLTVSRPSQPVVMDYDPDRLFQILNNLLANAFKYTPTGGSIHIKFEVEDTKTAASIELPLPSAKQLVITISDNGIGIPQGDLDKVFNRFFQAGNLGEAPIHTDLKLSSGIGMALVKELVQLMSGTVRLNSVEGKGTEVEVRLPITQSGKPLNPGEAYQLPKFVNIQMGEESEDELRQRMDEETRLVNFGQEDAVGMPRLLLVEDNKDVMEYLVNCLGKTYRLELAFNGKKGIERALDTVPDIIVSDIMMPEADGYELLETLKHDERTSHVPIILLTAKAGVENRVGGMKKGADAYLSKPFHQDELMAVINNLLETRKKLQAKYLSESLQRSIDGPQPEKTAPPTLENEFLTKLRKAIEENFSNPNLDSDTICRMVGMSRSNLHAKLTALTGMPITHYVRAIRLSKAKELLLTTQMNITEVADEVGYDNPRYFSRLFSEEFGMPPSEFRREIQP
jgi:signal transduction histidine kinase/CheY-like chemotaxis protein/AraC-like DNA-binding protein/ligand-binding sensor domain-containing protein